MLRTVIPDSIYINGHLLKAKRLDFNDTPYDNLYFNENKRYSNDEYSIEFHGSYRIEKDCDAGEFDTRDSKAWKKTDGRHN